MCCRCGDVLCATRTWKVCDVCWRLEGMGPVLLCMLEVMRCVLLCMLEVVEGVLYLLEDVGGAGGDALCTTLYSGGCGGFALFAGGVGGAGDDALCATPFARGCRGCALCARGIG